MAKVFSHGPTEENTKETITMTRSKDMVYLHGQIKEDMMDNGLTESNMEREFTPPAKEKSEEENGKKEKELGGLLMSDKCIVLWKFTLNKKLL